MNAQPASGNRNTIIIVVVVILLCCCCLAVAGGIYAERNVILQMMNGTAPTTRALLQLIA